MAGRCGNAGTDYQRPFGCVVIAIFLLSIGASFVQRTTGFGFGIFIMTMLPLVPRTSKCIERTKGTMYPADGL